MAATKARSEAEASPLVEQRLQELADIIRAVGQRLQPIGELVETHKWGQLSFLPKRPRIGTTVRIAAASDQQVALYVHCQTTLVDTWRSLFPELAYEGSRALVMDAAKPLPTAELDICIESALLYHFNKRKQFAVPPKNKGIATEATMTTQSYSGSCHCGDVTFEVDMDLDHVRVCDCSLCRKRGALNHRVEADALRITSSLEAMTLYQWHTLTARDYFCPRCGILPFRRPRTAPELWTINVRCLDGVDLDAIPKHALEGSRLD